MKHLLHIIITIGYNIKQKYMNAPNPHFKNQYVLLTYITLLIVATLAALLAVNNIVLSSDSMNYGLVSQQILAGNGIRIPIIGILGFDNTLPVNGTVPFLVQPPLLPMVLSLLGGLSPQSFLAPQILNFVCHIVISILVFLIMKHFSNQGIALLSGVLVSISLPLLDVTHRITSEILFTALTVASIYFLTLSRHCINYSRNILFASIFASAAILTRYAGIALLAMFFWEIIIVIRNKKLRERYWVIILVIAIPILTIAVLFVRNYIELGTIRGISLPMPERSHMDSFMGMIKMLFLQFQLGKLSAILMAAFIGALVLCIFSNAPSRKEALKVFNSGLDYFIVFIISYLALIYITLVKDQPYFELRYVTPLVPFLLIVIITLIVSVWTNIKLQVSPKLSLTGLILSLALITAIISYKTYLYIPEFFHKQTSQYSILNSCVYNWIKVNYDGDVIITTNEPYRLSFFGGYSTFIMPNRKWVPNVPIPENMDILLPVKMRETGSEVIALFEGVKEQHFGAYIATLFNSKEEDDNFYKVYECSDGVVYEMKE